MGGDRRTALLAIITVLGLNDVDFVADEARSATVTFGLAAGEIDGSDLTRRIRDSWPEP